MNLTETIHQALLESKREPDGLLHCSGDLCGSLRHVMLREAGAPQRHEDEVSSIILETGTMWHTRVGAMLVKQGVPFMQEVRMNKWLPAGWGGTADWVFWHDEYQGFVLGDLKTTAGEALSHIAQEGMKIEHHHQLSAYWWAMADAGFPLVKGFGVLYLPKNRAKNYDTVPTLVEAEPLDRDYLYALMRERREATDKYLADVKETSNRFINATRSDPFAPWDAPEKFMQDSLAPPMERVQKIAWMKDHYDVKLVPHWTSQFCPYSDDLCDCSKQGETKIGEYWCEPPGGTHLVYSARYEARKGYENIKPAPLTKGQERKLIG